MWGCFVELDRRDLLRAAGRITAVAGVASLPLTFAPFAAGPARAEISTEELMQAGPLGEQALGSKQAAVTVIEYASMTCPHCAAFHEDVYPELKQKYIDTGKIRFIFREFPLDPVSLAAFMLTRCAEPGKFFPFVEILFKKQRQWAFADDPGKELFNIAKFAGFTKDRFDACLKNEEIARGVLAVKERASEKFEVQSTPSFFINGEIYRGNRSFEDFQKLIEPLLEG